MLNSRSPTNTETKPTTHLWSNQQPIPTLISTNQTDQHISSTTKSTNKPSSQHTHTHTHKKNKLSKHSNLTQTIITTPIKSQEHPPIPVFIVADQSVTWITFSKSRVRIPSLSIILPTQIFSSKIFSHSLIKTSSSQQHPQKFPRCKSLSRPSSQN